MKFRVILAGIAGLLPASLIAVIVFLGAYAWPAIRYNGLGFLVEGSWSLGNLYADPVEVNGSLIPVGAHYGVLFLIVGTCVTAALALLFAIPLAVAAAIFLAEGLKSHLRYWVSFLVELLAAIPSVIFGLWGYVVLIPVLAHYVFPVLASALGFIPIFAGPTGSGYGLLTASVVLSLMVVPLITSTLRDALVAQPRELREAALALGTTRFEVAWRVLLPATTKVLVGGSILALGRALGETMAVLMVSGNALNYLPGNIYAPVSTMAAFIVSQLDSAQQDPSGMAVRSLAEIALILSIIAVAINAIARFMLWSYGGGLRRFGGGLSVVQLLTEAPALSIRGKQTDLYLRRRLSTAFGWGVSALALLLLLGAIVWILVTVFLRGVSALSPSLFTTITQGNGGGLLNAIEGTIVLSLASLLLAVPVGMAAGIYVSEFSHSFWAMFIRFLSDVLVGVPSIVLGYFGYVTMVVWLGWSFSVAAGAIVLAMICLPYICRTTELALGQLPMELREAAYALGASEGRVIWGICVPAALPGILTGVLLALAISVGETAPLLYTAGWSNFLWDGRLTHSPIGYLTYAVWTFINEPFASANALAYAAALLITSLVLLINVLSRLILTRSSVQNR